MIATHKFVGHLWYLNPRTIGLALLEKGLDAGTRRKMVDAVQRKGRATPLRADIYNFVGVPKPKRGELPNVRRLLHEVSPLSVDNFMDENTLSFFKIMGLPTGFLNEPPSGWDEHPDFLQCHNQLRHLNVCNDIAERAMCRMTNYANAVANIEERKQEVLRVVEYEIKNHGKCTREALNSYAESN